MWHILECHFVCVMPMVDCVLGVSYSALRLLGRVEPSTSNCLTRLSETCSLTNFVILLNIPRQLQVCIVM